MECTVASCPHRMPDKTRCPVAVSADRVRTGQSLVVASLELGRVLADRGGVTFRAQGTCMFPCVQPGDLLTIESRPIELVQMGDIVVFRRNGALFGHRAIAKGTHDGRTYVETRPDRSAQGSDGPSYAEDILGVCTKIMRHDTSVPLTPQSLRGPAAVRAAGWDWWNWKVCPTLVPGIGRVQRFRWYQRAATMWVDRTKVQRKFMVRVPLSAHQSHDLYRQFPDDRFEPDQPLWQGKPARSWSIDLHFSTDQPVAGTATIAWHPEGCPRGEGWWIENLRVRTKYRGAGLEDALFQKAGAILARSGMTLQGNQNENPPELCIDG